MPSFKLKNKEPDKSEISLGLGKNDLNSDTSFPILDILKFDKTDKFSNIYELQSQVPMGQPLKPKS